MMVHPTWVYIESHEEMLEVGQSYGLSFYSHKHLELLNFPFDVCCVCVWILVLHIPHIVFVMQLHIQEIRAVHALEFLSSKLSAEKTIYFGKISIVTRLEHICLLNIDN